MRNIKLISLLIVCGIISIIQVKAEPIIWLGGDGDWHDAAKWSSETVPGEGAIAEVNSGSISLTNGTAELAAFTINGGEVVFDGWESSLSAEEIAINGGSFTHNINTAKTTNAEGKWEPTARVLLVCSKTAYSRNQMLYSIEILFS
ncbi:MAG: hypothetical protein GX230_05595 [Lentisphaerae bacterium]|jgi:hypothetical protein|nr:hypothetical protein [Lentisphaerota bacterium]